MTSHTEDSNRNFLFLPVRKSNTRHILIQVLHAIILVALVLSYQLLVSKRMSHISFYYCISLIFIITTLREMFRERVSKIEIDSTKQQLIFSSKTFFSSTEQTRLCFAKARVETNSVFEWKANSLEIHFLSNKMEMMKISKEKDGFSRQQLEDIRSAVITIGLPVSKY